MTPGGDPHARAETIPGGSPAADSPARSHSARSRRGDTPRLVRFVAFWMIAGVAASVLALAWFGYRATREWRRSSLMLVQSRAEETAEILVRTLARDMRGVDDVILRSVHWDELPLDNPHEISDRIASAFARYPYPEAFFAWDGVRHDRNLVFFTRTDRRPHWLSSAPSAGAFPVTIVRDPASVSLLTRRFEALAAQGRRVVAFETTIGGRSYQVVARLLYRDPARMQLERVFGFTVDLEWVRNSYFPELTEEVARLTAGSAGLRIAILDDRGRAVAGTPAVANGNGPIIARPLLPLFFDHELVLLNPATDLPTQPWTVQVDTGSDPAVAVALRGADWTFGLATVATLVLTLGLLLVGRALRASGELTRLRADFVSSVTHELKTPLATIRSAAETLARGRVTDSEGISDYARLLDQEAQRLGRLVDNLLAYSRITDVSEVYTFEPLAVAELVDDLLRRFQVQFLYQKVDVHVDIPPDIADARADRTALLLVFDNLIDNALRYSPDRRELSIRAWCDERRVYVSIGDRGIGIPADEIDRVQLRFVRGRLARSNGSGLGLAIASRIIRDHGGELAIASVVGEGTTVTVTLPRESDA